MLSENAADRGRTAAVVYVIHSSQKLGGKTNVHNHNVAELSANKNSNFRINFRKHL